MEQRSERAGRAGVRVAVNSLAVDPMQPHIFATGGSDPLGKLTGHRVKAWWDMLQQGKGIGSVWLQSPPPTVQSV